MTRRPLSDLGTSLGEHLRQQREASQLSLRQLSALAGVSNPYLSQIERGLKRPSAEILQALAKGLQISAESLYVRAGFLDDEAGEGVPVPGVRAAIAADPGLTPRQKETLIGVYESFLGHGEPPTVQRPLRRASSVPSPATKRSTTRRSAPRPKAETRTGTATPKKQAVKKTAAKKTATTPSKATAGARTQRRPGI